MRHLPREITAEPPAKMAESPEKSNSFAIEKILI